MNELTSNWLDQKISGIVMSRTCSIKGRNTDKMRKNKDNKDVPIPEFEPIQISLKLDYSDLTLQQIFDKAVSADVVAYANTMRPQGQAAVANKENWTIKVKDFFAVRARGVQKSAIDLAKDMNEDDLASLIDRAQELLKAKKAG